MTDETDEHAVHQGPSIPHADLGPDLDAPETTEAPPSSPAGPGWMRRMRDRWRRVRFYQVTHRIHRWRAVPEPAKWTFLAIWSGILCLAFCAFGITLAPIPFWLKCFAYAAEALPVAPLCYRLAQTAAAIYHQTL